MIGSRPISQRIFDEFGYNMSASCKAYVLDLDSPRQLTGEKIDRILSEIGYRLSPSLKEDILALAKGCVEEPETAFHVEEKADILEEEPDTDEEE